MRMYILFFLGCDIDEPLPWHSTVSRTRQLFPDSLFEEVFTEVLKMCIEKGMVSGHTQVIDSAPVKANASMDSLELKVPEEELDELIRKIRHANIDETGEHGLVCAKADQSVSVRWYAGGYTNSMAFGDGPFAGEANTAIIIANQGYGDGATYAARICNELQITEGGKTYGDWYLPSKAELNQMYVNKAIIDQSALANSGSGFADNNYWSSTEAGNNNTWRQHFNDGYQSGVSKSNVYYVRAVRAF
jgi:hypothetical protein